MQDRVLLTLLGVLAFLPPLLFMLWVRNTERHQREPLGTVLAMFLYSGTLGIAVAVALNVFFVGTGSMLWAAVVVAPFMEELAKGLGFFFVRRRIREVEDGIIYGAALGLGFAATENFLYAIYTLGESGASDAITVAVARIFSSMLLHASSSALLGLGVSLAILRGKGGWQVLPFYLVAVGLHALYNFLVLGQSWAGFAAGIVMVIVVSTMMRRRVETLDTEGRLRST